MKRITIIIIIINFFSISYSQTFKGVIRDQLTDRTINLAAVYINGTTVGASSDNNGYFELNLTNHRYEPIIISAIGYYSITLSDYLTDISQIIYLTPKVYKLDEVVIAASGKTSSRNRRINLKLFKKEFLGVSINARKCELLNEMDVTLLQEKDNDTLKAFSSNPILINNKALGYRITYYLDKFAYCKTNGSLTIFGNYIFEDYSNSLEKPEKEKVENRRKKVYLGSRMHFFRSLWKNKIDSVGFSVINSQNNKLNYNELVTNTVKLTKNLNYKGNLVIKYYKRMETSRITIKRDYVTFDENGYFDPYEIYWDGFMAMQRIGDLLPFEYSIK